MARRKKKSKQPVVVPIPHQGIWIKAHMDENGGVTWTNNHPSAQRSSNLYGAVKDWFRVFNISTIKESAPSGAMNSGMRTREFKGAMAAALKEFNSRSHRRRFGVWFEIHTAPLDRAYTAWKLTQGGGQT